MNKVCERFEHTIEVKVTTQFPKPDIHGLIKQMLGPWCVSAKLIGSRDTENESISDT